MNKTIGKLKAYKGLIFCFLAAVLIAVLALYSGLLIEPGKILPTGLTMRTEKTNENLLYGINLAIEDINLIKSGAAGQNLWRLLTFIHMDLFFYIALILPQAATKTVLMIGYFVRFGLSCAAMYYFLSEHVKLSKLPSALLAVMYTFSSQIIFTAQFASIMNMSIMIPVLLSSADSYYKKRTWKSFVLVCLASFGLCISGGFGIVTAMPAMLFLTFLMATGLYKSLAMAFTSWLKVLGGLITGLVLSAAFSLPGLLVMDTQINLSESLSKAKVNFALFDFIRGMFMLRSGSITMNNSPIFYVGILTVIACLLFVLNENIPLRLKVFSGVFLAIFYAVCCSSFANETLSIFGIAPVLSATRLICLEALIFFIAAVGLKNIGSLNRGDFIVAGLIFLVFLIVSNNSTAGTSLAGIIMITTFIAIIAEAGIAYAIADANLSKKGKVAILIVVFAMVGINTSFIMFNNTITRTVVDEYFDPTSDEEATQSLIMDSDFELPALADGSKYQVVPVDLSIFEYGEYAIDDINFMSDNISGEPLFEEIYITPEYDMDVLQKAPDRFGLEEGTNEIPFSAFDVGSNERLFIHCTSRTGASVLIHIGDGDSERNFSGPFLTALDTNPGEVKLVFSIDSEGEDICYISLYKLNEKALAEFKYLSGDAKASRFMLDCAGINERSTLILPYAFDDTKVKVNGKVCNTFEYLGRLAVTFEADGANSVIVSIEPRESFILPGVLLSAFVAMCLVAIPVAQMYNKKKNPSEGKSVNA